MNKIVILSPLCKKGNKLTGLKPSPKISQPGGNRTQIWSHVGRFWCLLHHAVNQVNLGECPKHLVLWSLQLFSTSSRLHREKALNIHVVNQQVCEVESLEDSGLTGHPKLCTKHLSCLSVWLLGRLSVRSSKGNVNHRKSEAKILSESFFPETMAFISLKLWIDFY